MYNDILVGVDGQQGGRDAIALARELVSAHGRITLANVCPGYSIAGRGSNPEFEASVRDRARELMHQIRREAKVDADIATTASPSIGEGLHGLAEARHADLLVVGSTTRRGLLGRVLVGDDTWASLDGAPCAVAVVPAGYADEPHAIREVGVAYNGAPESEHALTVGRGLAAEHHAKLSVMQAVTVPTYAYAAAPAAAMAPLDETLDEIRSELARIEGAEAHAVYGVPSEELALYSASVSVLVVGARGYGPVGRLVHGSVTRQLVRTARCPLLVLTRAVREEEQAEHAMSESVVADA